jgi:hypothetical protein
MLADGSPEALCMDLPGLGNTTAAAAAAACSF